MVALVFSYLIAAIELYEDIFLIGLMTCLRQKCSARMKAAASSGKTNHQPQIIKGGPSGPPRVTAE